MKLRLFQLVGWEEMAGVQNQNSEIEERPRIVFELQIHKKMKKFEKKRKT